MPNTRSSETSFELSSLYLTENGYTPEFEAEILAEAESQHAEVADGTAEFINNSDELRRYLRE